MIAWTLPRTTSFIMLYILYEGRTRASDSSLWPGTVIDFNSCRKNKEKTWKFKCQFIQNSNEIESSVISSETRRRASFRGLSFSRITMSSCWVSLMVNYWPRPMAGRSEGESLKFLDREHDLFEPACATGWTIKMVKPPVDFVQTSLAAGGPLL